jgi:hypothetical protein
MDDDGYYYANSDDSSYSSYSGDYGGGSTAPANAFGPTPYTGVDAFNPANYSADGTYIGPTDYPLTSPPPSPGFQTNIWETGLLPGYGTSSGISLSGITSLLKSAGLLNDKGLPTAAAAGVLGGLYGMTQSNQPQQKTGYLGGIPQYSAVRQALPTPQTPGRRPGSGGQRYFSDVQFLKPGESPAAQPTTNLAAGGIATLAKGGEPRYLAGGTDGMADDLPARIDGKQEARLSHGEFVIPADVVSHLGNGNSESGAKRLYTMMEKIRKARTGNPKQGKQINPNKYLPA